MVGNILRNLVGWALTPKGPLPLDLHRDYRASMRKLAEADGVSQAYPTPHPDTAAIAIAELFGLAYERVYIFGSTLPPDVFLSSTVRAAMVAFRARNPHGRIIVITSDRAFTRAALMSYDDHRFSPEGTDFFLMPPELREDVHCQFVLIDGEEVPSHWRNLPEKGQADLTKAHVMFRDQEFSENLRALARRALLHYGSPN